VSNMTARRSPDWAGDIRSFGLAWGLPTAALAGGLFVDVPIRIIVWIIALAWMGTACILNARRCGRTHCRFTGPYYLAMIIPVLALGFAPTGLYGWLALGTLIVFGSMTIWWATERAWGKFRQADLPKRSSSA